MWFESDLVSYAIMVVYIVGDVTRQEYMTRVKKAVPASLERIAAMRVAITMTSIVVVAAVGVILYCGFAFKGDEVAMRYWDGIAIVLYAWITIIRVRDLIKLIKDDDSWFNRSWKKLKKWAKSLHLTVNFGFRPKTA